MIWRNLATRKGGTAATSSRMPLAKRETTEDIFTSFQREMNRLFEEFHHGFGLTPFRPVENASWMPLVNLSENDKELSISCELPGMDEKDISVTLSHNMLSIKGEKSEETEKKGKNYHRVERSFGSFYRDIPLPCEVEEDKVDAVFKKGVLYITMPKSKVAQQEARQIKIAKT